MSLQAFAHGAGHPAVDDIAERRRRRCQDKRHIGREIGVVIFNELLAQHYIPVQEVTLRIRTEATRLMCSAFF